MKPAESSWIFYVFLHQLLYLRLTVRSAIRTPFDVSRKHLLVSKFPWSFLLNQVRHERNQLASLIKSRRKKKNKNNFQQGKENRPHKRQIYGLSDGAV